MGSSLYLQSPWMLWNWKEKQKKIKQNKFNEFKTMDVMQ